MSIRFVLRLAASTRNELPHHHPSGSYLSGAGLCPSTIEVENLAKCKAKFTLARVPQPCMEDSSNNVRSSLGWRILPPPAQEPERHINLGRCVLPHPIRRFYGKRAFRIHLPNYFSRSSFLFDILRVISFSKTCFSNRPAEAATHTGVYTRNNLAFQVTFLDYHWHVTANHLFCGLQLLHLDKINGELRATDRYLWV
jgi:hypothetical protein